MTLDTPNQSNIVSRQLLHKLVHLEQLGGEADLVALDLIISERIRQIEIKGWTAAHDDANRRDGALAAAGACYGLHSSRMSLVFSTTQSLEIRPSAVHPCWPFSQLAWKPASLRRTQTKGSTFMVADLARLIRAGIL